MEIRLERMLEDLAALCAMGSPGQGGTCRLALTDADAKGRALVVGWMRALRLDVQVDQIGNVVATRPGKDATLAPVMTGGHIDTGRTGGCNAGVHGVVAGLEVVRALDDAAVRTRRPVSVALFTNGAGDRFAPAMLGSRVYTGEMPLDEALATVGSDGLALGSELERIGWTGGVPVPGPVPHAFAELQVEEGPTLEWEARSIGAVTGVPGISWQKLTLIARSDYAGTTPAPLRLRHDPAFVAGAVVTFVRRLSADLGWNQIGTVGQFALQPNRVDAVAATATLSVDLRNPDDAALTDAEERLAAFVADMARAEGVAAHWRRLARFAPVSFDPAIVAAVEAAANTRGHLVMRLAAGTGHDAQILASRCPTGMIFVPSRDAVSHNSARHIDSHDLAAGTEVLLDVLVELAS